MLLLTFLTYLVAPVRAAAQEGFFHVEQRQGVWWLIDPSGAPMLSAGVDHIAYEADRVRGTGPCPYCEALDKIYPDRNAWGLMALARMRLWGFNTIGAWSDAELWTHSVPYTVILDIAQAAGADWWHGKPVDVYDPRFEKVAGEIAQKMSAPRKDDRFLIGYFSDNELRWGPDWRGKENMLEMYLKLPADAPGRQKAINFLRLRYRDDIQQLNTAWGVNATRFEDLAAAGATDAYKADANQFLEDVARRYFRVCSEAIHVADPNHLYLGARFAGRVPDAVLRGARAADVVSINIYAFDPRSLVERVFEVTGKPVLITEFAFRAEDSGLPNTQGAGPKVPNQLARAKAFTDYVTWLESLPEAVGYHWFEWVDEPKEGRFDGENSNYGLVDIRDNPYQEFVEAVRQANAAALDAHKKAAK
jgi:agarase